MRSLDLELAVCVKGNAWESYKCDERMEWYGRAKWECGNLGWDSGCINKRWMEYLGTELIFIYKGSPKTKKLLVSFSLSTSFLCSALVLKRVLSDVIKWLQNIKGSKKKQTSLYLGIYLTDVIQYSWAVCLKVEKKKYNLIFISISLYCLK